MDEEQADVDASGPTPEQEELAAGPVVSTIEGWRGGALPLSLTEADLELLDRVMCVYPELRIVAFLGQVARSRGMSYPVRRAEDLAEVLGEQRFELGEHR